MDLKEVLRREARRLGFTRVGFATVGEQPDADRLREWLDRGYAGTMEWLRRRLEQRTDPARLIPWARSLVVATFPYPAPPREAAPMTGQVSRYAVGRDYHEVVKERLVELQEVLAHLAPGSKSRAVVDTAAVMEKPWAFEAGLGWVGKHTNLIDPRDGSWFFLGEILTDLELRPDEARLSDRCGTCTRCLDACPTQALPEPYVLDARRCISYLTIEHRGAIPEDLRSGMGDWIFGCDVCQEVCPWNDGRETDLPESGARSTDLIEMLELSREEFNRRFAGTALRRTGWSRFLRNVAVALGNSGDPRAVAPLRKALDLPDPLIHEHVQWALRRLGAAGADALTSRSPA